MAYHHPFFLVNLVPLCYHRLMRRFIQKIFQTFFVFLFLFVPLPSQATDPQTAWVKGGVDDQGKGDGTLMV